MIMVFGVDFPAADGFVLCVVMTDSLHRDWPGQVQWVCSQPPLSLRTLPPAGQHPSLMTIFGLRPRRCKVFLRDSPRGHIFRTKRVNSKGID